MKTKFFATRITDILKEIDFTNLTTQDQFKLLLVFYKFEYCNPLNADLKFFEGLDTMIDYADCILNSQKVGNDK